MGVNNKIIKSIETIADRRVKDFDRTVQAIVKDNSDPNKIGEIKVFYKDATIPVYTDRNQVKNYKNGSHVYITIPNNDMNARKTLLGLVEQVGPLSIVSDNEDYLIDSRYSANTEIYFKDTELSSDYLQSLSFIDQKIYQNDIEIDENDNRDFYLNLKLFLQNLKNAFIESNYVRFTAKFSAIIPSSQRNILGSNYGIKFYLLKKDDESVKKIEPALAILDINQLTGNPFLQSDQKQSIILDTTDFSKKEDIDGIKIEYFRENIDFNDNKFEISSPFIIVKDFLIEKMNFNRVVETNDLSLYVVTPKGKIFMNQGDGTVIDILELRGAIKQNRIQLDSSALKCWWYERDTSFNTISNPFNEFDNDEDNTYNKKYWRDRRSGADESIFTLAGVGWRLVKSDKNIDTQSELYKELLKEKGSSLNIINYNVSGSNTFYVKKSDLEGFAMKEYKVVGLYNGVQLSSTITISNANAENDFKIVIDREHTDDIDKTIYTLKMNDYDSNQYHNYLNHYSIKWFYMRDGCSSQLLKINNIYSSTSYGNLLEEEKDIRNTNSEQLVLYNNLFKYSGQIICEITKIDNTHPYATLTEIYGPTTTVDVLFNNFEQVFLYDFDEKIIIRNNDDDEEGKEDNYSVNLRPLSVSGNVNSIKWYIPRNSFFEYPDQSGDKNFFIVESKLSIPDLKIKTTFPKSAFEENIIVEYSIRKGNNIKTYSKTTNFSFAREGDDGTNGTGVFMRILPLVEEDEQCPNNVVMGTQYIMGKGEEQGKHKPNILFNFKPARAMLNNDYTLSKDFGFNAFTIQLWKKNQKFFDGNEKDLSNNINSVQWSALYKDTNNNSILKIESYNGKMAINSLTYENYKTCLQQYPQGVKATVTYSQNSISYSLPFITYYKPPAEKNGDIRINGLKKISLQQGFDDDWTTNDIKFEGYLSLNHLYKYYFKSDGTLDKTRYEIIENKKGWLKKSFNNTKIHLADNSVLKLDRDLFIAFVKSSNTNSSSENDFLLIKDNYFLKDYYDILFKHSDISYQPAFDVTNCFIPFLTFLNDKTDRFLTTWDGLSVDINDKDGNILAPWIAAGKINASHNFSGAIIGENNIEDNGLNLYKEGLRTLSIEDNGTIRVTGETPSDGLVIDSETFVIGKKNKNGLKLDFEDDKISFIKELSKDTVFSIENSAGKKALSMSADGALKMKNIIGESDGNKEFNWYYYNFQNDGQYIDKHIEYIPSISEKLFINEDGSAGFNKIIVGKTDLSLNSVIRNGIVINNSTISNNMVAYGSKFLLSSDILEGSGFFIGPDGIAIGQISSGMFKNNNQCFSMLRSDGWIRAGQGFFIGSQDSTNELYNSNKAGWYLSRDGLRYNNGVTYIGRESFKIGSEKNNFEYSKNEGNNCFHLRGYCSAVGRNNSDALLRVYHTENNGNYNTIWTNGRVIIKGADLVTTDNVRADTNVIAGRNIIANGSVTANEVSSNGNLNVHGTLNLIGEAISINNQRLTEEIRVPITTPEGDKTLIFHSGILMEVSE